MMTEKNVCADDVAGCGDAEHDVEHAAGDVAEAAAAAAHCETAPRCAEFAAEVV